MLLAVSLFASSLDDRRSLTERMDLVERALYQVSRERRLLSSLQSLTTEEQEKKLHERESTYYSYLLSLSRESNGFGSLTEHGISEACDDAIHGFEHVGPTGSYGALMWQSVLDLTSKHFKEAIASDRRDLDDAIVSQLVVRSNHVY
jgi:hypothetical protein